MKVLSCLAILITSVAAKKCRTTSDIHKGICSTNANLVLYVKFTHKREKYSNISHYLVERYSVIKASSIPYGTFISLKRVVAPCHIDFEAGLWYVLAGQYFAGSSYLLMDPRGYSEKWSWVLWWKILKIEHLYCLKSKLA